MVLRMIRKLAYGVASPNESVGRCLTIIRVWRERHEAGVVCTSNSRLVDREFEISAIS